MVKYYKPEDIQADVDFASGSNTAIFPDWIGREVVSFGRTGAYPAYPVDDWSWDKDTGTITLNAVDDIFQPLEKFHLEFEVITDAVQEFTDVIDPGTDITQYPHILRYSINSWATDAGEVTNVERRCRVEYNSKARIELTGTVAKAIVYIPLPAITIKENIPVIVYNEDEVFESGTVLQYRKGLFNQRLWL